MEFAGYLTFRGKMSYACIILGRKPERLRNRWEDNIKIHLDEGVQVYTRFIWLRIGTSGGL